MEKDFLEWHILKEELQQRKDIPPFKEREIWWTSIGLNIGDEQDGKNKFFNRPVLIIRRLTPRLFLGIPLSTRIKPDNPYYYQFTFKGIRESAILMQSRAFSGKRLSHKMGELGKKQFNEIKEAYRRMI